MKKVGLVGGISWVSTMDYYKLINEGVNRELGGLQAAEIVLHSLNFASIQEKGWLHSFEILLRACQELEKAQVDGIALCANTAHLFADDIQQRIQLPLIHGVTATVNEIDSKKLSRVGLLGTKFTMEMDFFKTQFQKNGIEVIIPKESQTIDRIQYILKKELGKGLVKESSKREFLGYSNQLIERGAQGIILGCTEIPLLIGPHDFATTPLFDTTQIHSKAIVDFILGRY